MSPDAACLLRRIQAGEGRELFVAPSPDANWWGLAADMAASDSETSEWVIEIDATTDVPANLLVDLVRAGMLSADERPEGATPLDGGDDLDLATHVYSITPAGRAYLSSLTERTKE